VSSNTTISPGGGSGGIQAGLPGGPSLPQGLLRYADLDPATKKLTQGKIYHGRLPQQGFEFAYDTSGKRFEVPLSYFTAQTNQGNQGNTTMATGPITTDAQVEQEVGTLAAGMQGGVPQLSPVLQTVDPNELMSGTGTQLAGQVTAGTTTAPTTGLQVGTPAAPGANVGQVSGIQQIAPQIGTVQAEQISTAPQIDFAQDVEGQVSQQSISTAATQQLDPQATTQYQLSQLMAGIQQGQPLPPWASPAVRKVAGIMQARGLGASSMAAAAMTQAVMESGVVIASQDANKYATIQLKNLSNQQQTALANAATFAAMDKANLSARLQSAVTNAQALLATETKNLDARQQSNVITYNALTQSAFKDSAEENARRQFNAKNELQVDEFFAELGSQVETANANRQAGIEQFNAGEINAQNQFNASLRDNREKFNANMQYAIDQSNVQWRRQTNTANTAVQNESNRIDVQNLYNASQNALNNLWQKYRDNAAWNFQKSESYLQRQHEIGIMAMEFANTKELYDQQQKDDLALGIGNWLAAWMAGSGS
jgi:hypothetical protein